VRFNINGAYHRYIRQHTHTHTHTHARARARFRAVASDSDTHKHTHLFNGLGFEQGRLAGQPQLARAVLKRQHL